MRITLIAVGVALGIVVGFTTAWVVYDPGRQDSDTTITDATPVEPARSSPEDPGKTLTLTEIAALV